MAECPSCGKDTSIWGRDLISGVCNECVKARKAAEQAAKAQSIQEREAAEAARLEQRVWD